MSDKVILLVDDDEADLFFLSKALRRFSPDVLIACVSDGQQAIDYLVGQGKYTDRKAWPFPMHMFLDLKMPLVSGLEVLRWLRHQPPEIGQLPVTVFSGSELTADVEQVRALGAEYIVKPVGNAALLAIARDFAEKYLRQGVWETHIV